MHQFGNAARAAMVLFFLVAALCERRASALTLQWTASPGAAGYFLYSGTNSHAYNWTEDGQEIDCGSVTNIVITPAPGVTTYYSLTAYNADGEETEFSGEVTSNDSPAPPPTGNITVQILRVDHLIIGP